MFFFMNSFEQMMVFVILIIADAVKSSCDVGDEFDLVSNACVPISCERLAVVARNSGSK
jgi:hypothetical protein